MSTGNDNNGNKKDEDCSVHAEKLRQLESSDREQWQHINRWNETIRKYVPVWTTIVLMIMSCLTGSALTFAGMMLKFSGK